MRRQHSCEPGTQRVSTRSGQGAEWTKKSNASTRPRLAAAGLGPRLPAWPCPVTVPPSGSGEEGWVRGCGGCGNAPHSWAGQPMSPSLLTSPFNGFWSRLLLWGLCPLLRCFAALPDFKCISVARPGLALRKTARRPQGGPRLSPGGWDSFLHPTLSPLCLGPFEKFWTSGVGSPAFVVWWVAEGRCCALRLGAAL